MPVLLLDGEELVGARQNRVLNTSILLKENSETIIPVSCTEQGRWSHVSQSCSDSGLVAGRRLRCITADSVARNLRESGRHRSDQGAVWEDLSRVQRRTGVSSPTGAMSDVVDRSSISLWTTISETCSWKQGRRWGTDSKLRNYTI